MPAYRSSAEAEIRAAAIERLRSLIPGCRIIHEINAETFGNRIDILAVGADRIAAVEIKSSKDTLSRLPDQIKAMSGVTNEVFAAIHEKFLAEVHGSVYPPDAARGAVTWVYPRVDRTGSVECGSNWLERHRWTRLKRCLPDSAINILWRDELHGLCKGLGVRRVAKMDMAQAIDEIRWRMTGEEVTRIICRTLRSRPCVEADAPIAANDNNKQDITSAAA